MPFWKKKHEEGRCQYKVILDNRQYDNHKFCNFFLHNAKLFSQINTIVEEAINTPEVVNMQSHPYLNGDAIFIEIDELISSISKKLNQMDAEIVIEAINKSKLNSSVPYKSLPEQPQQPRKCIIS